MSKELLPRQKRQSEIENFERQRRIYQFKQVIKDFRRMEFEVREVEPFRFRIQDCIDVMPITREFYDLKKNIKGEIKGVSFDSFLRGYFGIMTSK